ncbi:hypothetical protein GUJ93_ZPchr0014g47442 [Zizania palustris]|uniref:Uncharacterized protein n=1 Tax=Zizania palustris TaxID=103762 RepID=A0A8J5SWM5_ZIZPA|nr:hypothetical protein GUJ93_ZPchr0014g47442 [Zizania palustris]
MLVDLIDEDAAQRNAHIDDAASIPESQDNLEQVRTPAAQENLPQDEAPVNEGGVEVAAEPTSILGEVTTVALEDAPTIEDLTVDSDEDFGVAFDPPSSPMLTRRQNVEVDEACVSQEEGGGFKLQGLAPCSNPSALKGGADKRVVRRVKSSAA